MALSKPVEERYRPNGKLRDHKIRSPRDLALGCGSMLYPYVFLFVGVRPPREFVWWTIGVTLSGVICMGAAAYWADHCDHQLARRYVSKQVVDFTLRAVVQAIWWWLVWGR